MEVAAEHDLVAPRQQGERAEVEDLVVQRAQREAVRLQVRPARLEPLDVRGFEALTFPSLRGRKCAGRARRRSSGIRRRAAPSPGTRDRGGAAPARGMSRLAPDSYHLRIAPLANRVYG